MILLDTHIWIWWVDSPSHLTPTQRKIIQEGESEGIGVSAISVWEIAKLVEKGRIKFSKPLKEWIDKALDYPGIQLINLSPEISVMSTQLPGNFHKDPADQIIVATAKVLSIPLLTADRNILKYEHVELIE